MWQQAVHGSVEAVAAGAAKRGEELGGGHRPGGRAALALGDDGAAGCARLILECHCGRLLANVIGRSAP